MTLLHVDAVNFAFVFMLHQKRKSKIILKSHLRSRLKVVVRAWIILKVTNRIISEKYRRRRPKHLKTFFTNLLTYGSDTCILYICIDLYSTLLKSWNVENNLFVTKPRKYKNHI